jgi:hypothetical protein
VGRHQRGEERGKPAQKILYSTDTDYLLSPFFRPYDQDYNQRAYEKRPPKTDAEKAAKKKASK